MASFFYLDTLHGLYLNQVFHLALGGFNWFSDPMWLFLFILALAGGVLGVLGRYPRLGLWLFVGAYGAILAGDVLYYTPGRGLLWITGFWLAVFSLYPSQNWQRLWLFGQWCFAQGWLMAVVGPTQLFFKMVPLWSWGFLLLVMPASFWDFGRQVMCRLRDQKGKDRSVRPFQFLHVAVVLVFVAIQCVLPLRQIWLRGDVNWTGEGDYFSWRPFLSVKQGEIVFTVINAKTGEYEKPKLDTALTEAQRFALKTQPDVVWQMAQMLQKKYQQKGWKPVVTVTHLLSLNGQPLGTVIDPTYSLGEVPYSWVRHNPWILDQNTFSAPLKL
ncbi:MAG: HTTM domain-containing protein [Candidatus Margulisiibacteriota bacterium]